MNRMSLAETELARLQNGIAGALPPIDQSLFFDRGMIGEQTFTMCYYERWSLMELAYGFDGYSWTEERTAVNPFPLLTHGTRIVLTDVSGERRIDPICMCVCFDMIRKHAKTEAAQHRVLGAAFPEKWWKHMLICAPDTCFLMPGMSERYNWEWRTRTQLDIARTAIAVERFRFAQCHLPDRLDELVPRFLDGVPRDFFHTGKPLSYRVKENGEFVVYSYGHNQKDDHGEEYDKDGKRHGEDFTFTVAPLEVRDRPQVAPEAAAQS